MIEQEITQWLRHAPTGAPKVTRGRAKYYNCGREHLTVAMIAKRTGTQVGGIYQRISKGQTGTELLRGPKTKLYEVGTERMSLQQLCERAGVSERTMSSRLARGWRGKDLLIENGERRRRGMARSPTQHIAFKLAFAFGRYLPTTKEIMAVHRMSHASAMRWRNAMAQALDSLSSNYK